MAGGSGTRFWPKSSKKNPKQLLALTGPRSLLQMTTDRLKTLAPIQNTLVVATKLLSKAIKKQLPGVRVLAEPEGRNTMAAVCLSAWEVARLNPDASIAVLPADAHIENVKLYQLALHQAFEVCESDNRIVCLGIKPTFAATGYGYIEAAQTSLSHGAYTIARFIEKPNTVKAEEFFKSGQYLWNAGIFVFKASVFINEVRNHAPEFAKQFDLMMKSKKTFNSLYKKLPKQPVDIALMEKTSLGAVIAGDFGWNDLGSWPALEEVLKSTSAAGLVQAPAGHLSIDSRGLIADITSKKLVAFIGVENLIVVETENALLICAKDRAQDIKKIVEQIDEDKKLRTKYL
jgi:mannose-1-phosphate guanylyltransferase